MRTVNILEAKAHLSRLIEQAAKGESFVIAKAGKPIVKIVPIDHAEGAARRVRFMSGHFTTPGDFDRMGSDQIKELFGLRE